MLGQLLMYWGCMIFFYIIAAKLRERKELFAWVEPGLNIAVYALCLVMGLRMGSNEEITSQLSTVGVQSLIVTAMCVFGSMFFVFLTRKLLKLDRDGAPLSEVRAMEEFAKGANEQAEGLESAEGKAAADEKAEKVDNSNSIRFTVIILVIVALGMLAGYFVVPVTLGYEKFSAISSTIITVGLMVLLALVGLSLGLSGEVIRNIKSAGLKVLCFPVAAILGSFVMGALYGLIGPMTVREGLAISAGFGWYTFAPGCIIDAGHAIAGAVSFMHNVIRETLGIIIIPLVVQKIGALEATAIPGVAAMDICMPIVERSVKRPEVVVYSFATGCLMSFAVIIFVPLFIG